MKEREKGQLPKQGLMRAAQGALLRPPLTAHVGWSGQERELRTPPPGLDPSKFGEMRGGRRPGSL